MLFSNLAVFFPNCVRPRGQRYFVFWIVNEWVFFFVFFIVPTTTGGLAGVLLLLLALVAVVVVMDFFTLPPFFGVVLEVD